MKALAVLAMVVGCGGASLGPGNEDTKLDASVGTDGPATDSTPTDAPPACANGRKLYLHFEGITLTKAAASDSTQNQVSWMGNTTVTLPAYHAGVGERADQIASIVDGVKARLVAQPIEIVTQRPAAGPYVMVVLGGSNIAPTTASTTQVQTQYSYGTNEHDCGDVVKNDVAWIADLPPVDIVPDLVVAAVGWGLGLNGTSDPNGCLCGWANSCVDAAGACVLSASIDSTTSVGNTTCPNMNPQNEVAAFSTGYCQ